ncbi:hypothetical protein DFJ74DRAFT_677340 [Hyaloraphidium curvatum]|nr:hypothetical protein DFJ74DRAFT_677340 [Hyaloraphidium curvatum]
MHPVISSSGLSALVVQSASILPGYPHAPVLPPNDCLAVHVYRRFFDLVNRSFGGVVLVGRRLVDTSSDRTPRRNETPSPFAAMDLVAALTAYAAAIRFDPAFVVGGLAVVLESGLLLGFRFGPAPSLTLNIGGPGGIRVIAPDEEVHGVCYLQLWFPADEAGRDLWQRCLAASARNDAPTAVTLDGAALEALYGGQTENTEAREAAFKYERVVREVGRVPDLKLGLVTGQQNPVVLDLWETILIWLICALFGAKAKNLSPYPKHSYVRRPGTDVVLALVAERVRFLALSPPGSYRHLGAPGFHVLGPADRWKHRSVDLLLAIFVQGVLGDVFSGTPWPRFLDWYRSLSLSELIDADRDVGRHLVTETGASILIHFGESRSPSFSVPPNEALSETRGHLARCYDFSIRRVELDGGGEVVFLQIATVHAGFGFYGTALRMRVIDVLRRLADLLELVVAEEERLMHEDGLQLRSYALAERLLGFAQPLLGPYREAIYALEVAAGERGLEPPLHELIPPVDPRNYGPADIDLLVANLKENLEKLGVARLDEVAELKTWFGPDATLADVAGAKPAPGTAADASTEAEVELASEDEPFAGADRSDVNVVLAHAAPDAAPATDPAGVQPGAPAAPESIEERLSYMPPDRGKDLYLRLHQEAGRRYPACVGRRGFDAMDEGRKALILAGILAEWREEDAEAAYHRLATGVMEKLVEDGLFDPKMVSPEVVRKQATWLSAILRTRKPTPGATRPIEKLFFTCCGLVASNALCEHSETFAPYLVHPTCYAPNDVHQVTPILLTDRCSTGPRFGFDAIPFESAEPAFPPDTVTFPRAPLLPTAFDYCALELEREGPRLVNHRQLARFVSKSLLRLVDLADRAPAELPALRGCELAQARVIVDLYGEEFIRKIVSYQQVTLGPEKGKHISFALLVKRQLDLVLGPPELTLFDARMGCNLYYYRIGPVGAEGIGQQLVPDLEWEDFGTALGIRRAEANAKRKPERKSDFSCACPRCHGGHRGDGGPRLRVGQREHPLYLSDASTIAAHTLQDGEFHLLVQRDAADGPPSGPRALDVGPREAADPVCDLAAIDEAPAPGPVLLCDNCTWKNECRHATHALWLAFFRNTVVKRIKVALSEASLWIPALVPANTALKEQKQKPRGLGGQKGGRQRVRSAAAPIAVDPVPGEGGDASDGGASDGDDEGAPVAKRPKLDGGVEEPVDASAEAEGEPASAVAEAEVEDGGPERLFRLFRDELEHPRCRDQGWSNCVFEDEYDSSDEETWGWEDPDWEEGEWVEL